MTKERPKGPKVSQSHSSWDLTSIAPQPRSRLIKRLLRLRSILCKKGSIKQIKLLDNHLSRILADRHQGRFKRPKDCSRVNWVFRRWESLKIMLLRHIKRSRSFKGLIKELQGQSLLIGSRGVGSAEYQAKAPARKTLKFTLRHLLKHRICLRCSYQKLRSQKALIPRKQNTCTGWILVR